MDSFNKKKRQGVLGAGLASLAAAVSVHEVSAAIKPKAPGETKIVAVFGITDKYNGIGHEVCIRQIFESKKDWRMIFIRAAGLFTPQLISDADLLILCRDGDPDTIDLAGENGFLDDKIVTGAIFYTDTNVKAIIDNVRNRGMGLLAMHSTIMCGNRQFMDFMDVEGIEPHNIEPIWYTRINKTHPVTQGIGKFSAVLDTQPAAIIKSAATATLFESTAVHEKRQAISGWALESGKGRIVGLLPGSTTHAYQATEYRNIVWRAAHWAMRRDIQPYPNAKNVYYD